MCNSKKQKAVFLDRDGVINSDEGHYYIFKVKDLKINPGIPELIKKLKDFGYLIIVISNQGGIAKRIYHKDDTDKLHLAIDKVLKKHETSIDAYYYCPHHPETGNCLCRKPSGLMIEKALARFNIDPQQSYMIGDSKRDIEAAENAGVRGVLVPKNYNFYEFTLEK